MIKLAPLQSGTRPASTLPVLYRPNAWQSFSPFSLFFTVSLILIYLLYAYTNLKGHVSDENFHANMIDALRHGKFDNLPTNVTTPPLLHGIIALLVHLSGATDKILELMRYIQFALSIIAIPFFYLISKRLHHNDCDYRTLACLLLPIYLPLYGTVYTDPPTVAMNMIMVYFTLSRNYLAAAMIALIGLGFRQMTIIWVTYCGMWVIMNELEDRFVSRGWAHLLKDWQWFKPLFVKLLPFLIPVIAFLAYLMFNEGIVAGDKEAHKLGINVAGFFFFLITTFILFLPYCLHNFSTIINLIFEKKWSWITLSILLLLFIFFYKVSHPYNGTHLNWWIHNTLLNFSTGSFAIKALFFIAAIWSFFNFYVIAQQHPKRWTMYLLYFFALLSFLPMPLIEARYYIVGILLFILWKPSQGKYIEQLSLLYWLGLTTFIIYGISQREFFL